MSTDGSATGDGAQRGPSAGELHVEVVSVEQDLWSGAARTVVARTTEGEIGILPGHTPLLGRLTGVVRIRRTSDDDLVVAPHGGFISVTDDGVSILAETAEFAADIDADRAQQALERARSADGPEAKDAEARAVVRLAAVGRDV